MASDQYGWGEDCIEVFDNYRMPPAPRDHVIPPYDEWPIKKKRADYKYRLNDVTWPFDHNMARDYMLVRKRLDVTRKEFDRAYHALHSLFQMPRSKHNYFFSGENDPRLQLLIRYLKRNR